MVPEIRNGLTRIGVFYDGNYFLHVSNYYVFQHARASRISIRGLHDFIRSQVAKEEDVSPKLCHVVDAHYFRGRLSAYEAKEMNRLFSERQFDDILMNEGVTTHYLPIRTRRGKREEKGIDVWLALEAFELAILKKYNVIVLIGSDGDYVPLIRKLNTIGIKVMLLSWDFEFTDEQGEMRETRTSQDLLEEVTYPVAMHEVIENRMSKSDPLITNLFVSNEVNQLYRDAKTKEIEASKDLKVGIILDVKKGFGFIEYPPNNLFFHTSDLVDTDFNDLQRFDRVEYLVGYNDKGLCAKNVRKVQEYDSSDESAHEFAAEPAHEYADDGY